MQNAGNDFAKKLENHKVNDSDDGHAFCLKSDGITTKVVPKEGMQSNQEETDT